MNNFRNMLQSSFLAAAQDVRDDAELAKKMMAEKSPEDKRFDLLNRLGIVDEVHKKVRFSGDDPRKPYQIPGASSFSVLASPYVNVLETEDSQDQQVLANETWIDVEFDVALDSGSQEHVCDDVDYYYYYYYYYLVLP